jgi:hypothetical protein
MFFDHLIGELLGLPQIGPLLAKDAPKSKSAIVTRQTANFL